MIIGIDFGTCFSSAAIMNGLIPVTNYLKDETGEGIPSLFMYSAEQDKELYGDECNKGNTFLHSADIIRYMKRTVRENPENLDMKIKSGGKEYTISQVIEKFLTYLIAEIRAAAVNSGEFSNNEIEAVTITAPIGIAQDKMMASDYNKLLQETVCRITELDKTKVRILQEPVAAAISYLYSQDIRTHYEDKQTVLVFDLGGGTLDVTAVQHDPKSMTYEILSKEGDLQLGGNEWDECLKKAVLKKIGITDEGSDEEKARLAKAITKLKMDLTKSEESMIFFIMNGQDKFCKFSRKEFNDCTTELLDRAMEVLNKAIEAVPGGIESINKIVLVGGSSNMPQIKDRIEFEYDVLSNIEVLLYDPSKAIAKGAAVFAKMNSSINGSEFGGRVIDCATMTYGFESHRGGAPTPMLYNMIYKNTPFDDTGLIRITTESDFVPLYDDQTLVEFDIYESEMHKNESNWFDMGSGESLNGLRCTVQVPPEFLGRARGFQMWVTLTLDVNGILEISVRDRAGNKLSYASTVKNSSEGY